VQTLQFGGAAMRYAHQIATFAPANRIRILVFMVYEG